MKKKVGRSSSAYAAPVVIKTIDVLTVIAKASTNPGVSEIAAELELAKSTTHGILAALEQKGWVLRDPITRKYTCGHALTDLAQEAHVRIPFVEKARPYLERLGSRIDEDVFFGMFTPYHIVLLDLVESSKRLKVATRPGTKIPIFAGAAGKIFLAYMDRASVEEILREQGLPAFTPQSITDREEYLQELDRVVEHGTATDFEEYIPGVRAISAPVFHGNKSRKRIVAGIWVVGLTAGFSEDEMKRVAALAREAADEISGELSKQ